MREAYGFLARQGAINFGLLRGDPRLPLPPEVEARVQVGCRGPQSCFVFAHRHLLGMLPGWLCGCDKVLLWPVRAGGGGGRRRRRPRPLPQRRQDCRDPV